MKLYLAVFLSVLSFTSWGQTDFVAVTNGYWDVGTTWGGLCESGCATGVDFPGEFDDVYTNGFQITVRNPASPSTIITCKNLAVESTTPGSLIFPGQIIVTGTMGGILGGLGGFPEAPSVNVFSGTPTITFTAKNLDGINPFFFALGTEVLVYWNRNAPLGNVLFNLLADAVLDGGDLINGGDSELQFTNVNFGSTTGIVYTLETGSNLTGIRVSGALSVGGSRRFVSMVPIGGVLDLNTSRIGNLTINGTFETSSHVNSTGVSIGATGLLKTEFAGADQTQGWWFQSVAPTGIVTLNGTVEYAASGLQNVFIRSYGSLTMTGGSKTLAGSGTSIGIRGTLTSTVPLTFGPAVVFESTTAKTIAGTGALTFNGGLTVQGGTLFMSNTQSTLSGSFANSGTVTSSETNQFNVSGAASFTGTGSFSLNHFTVLTGSTASFAGSVAFSGNLTNNNVLSFSNSGTVSFNGTNNQTISGRAFQVFNLTVNKGSSTLNNNGNIELLGNLTMSGGTFDADGSGSGVLTLNSDTNGDATIGPMTGGSVTGRVAFERFYQHTVGLKWRNFGFPITGVHIDTIRKSIPLGTGYVNYYTESTTGDVSQGWTAVNSGTLPLTSRGYSIFNWFERDITLRVSGPLLRTTPATISSPFSFAGITYTNSGNPSADGWNFVPNPFACPINWTNAGWTRPGINTVAAVWDATNEIYRYTDADWDGVVAAGQGFWIQTNNSATPVLQCTESVKYTAVRDPDFYRKKSSQAENQLRLTLRDATKYDMTLIAFSFDATEQFDPQFDAYKLQNRIFNLSSISPRGENLALNHMPFSACSKFISLNITNINPGNYTLAFEGLGSFAKLDSVVLQDRFTKTSRKINDMAEFSFAVTEDPASFGQNRFSLRFYYKETTNDAPTIDGEGTGLSTDVKNASIQWFHNGAAVPGATKNSFIPVERGSYIVQITRGNCVLTSDAFVLEQKPSRLFPNPAQTQFNVITKGFFEENKKSAKLFVYSLDGRIVLEQDVNSVDEVKSVPLVGVRPGTYIVNVRGADTRVLYQETIIIE